MGTIRKICNEQAVLVRKKGEVNGFSVNYKLINTKGYHDKFMKLPLASNVCEVVYRECGRLLERTDGNEEEYMIALGARTGKLITDNLKRQGNIRKTSFNKDEYRAISESKEQIILIHNHSLSVRPSGRDIVTYVKNDKIRMSIVVCHDGDVYALLNGKKEVAEIYENAYNEYRRNYNQSISKVLAAQVLYDKNINSRLFDLRRL